MDLVHLYYDFEIQRKIFELAIDLKKRYEKKNPILLVVLKGAFIFASDLVRRLDFPYEIEFTRIHTYQGTNSSADPSVILTFPVVEREVLIIEDIVDTGRTMKALKTELYLQRATSVKICSLLDKPSRREVECNVDYPGFKIENLFVVGYGMDYNEQYRGLKEIKYIKGEPK